MTEESFQQARKVMQSANYLRGMITTAKGSVAKWTKLESANRTNLEQAKADGCKKALDIAIGKLQKARDKFAALKFPENDIPNKRVESIQCEGCGARIAKGNTYCGECLCED